MADSDEMVKQVTGHKPDDIRADKADAMELLIGMAERIWKLEARLAKVEGRL